LLEDDDDDEEERVWLPFLKQSKDLRRQQLVLGGAWSGGYGSLRLLVLYVARMLLSGVLQRMVLLFSIANLHIN